MANRKRTSEQVDMDRALIARLLVRGYNHLQITATINNDPNRPYTLSRQSIDRDVKVVRKEFLKERNRDMEQVVGLELLKIHELTKEAFAAFEKSKAVLNPELRAALEAAKLDPKTVMPGDPRFLQVILAAQDRQAKLLGLDAPKKHDVDVRDERQKYREMPQDQRRARIGELLGRMPTKAEDAAFPEGEKVVE